MQLLLQIFIQEAYHCGKLPNPPTLPEKASVILISCRYSESEHTTQKCLKRMRNLLGLQHLKTSTSRNNLASVLQKQCKYDEAEQLYRQALQEREAVLGSAAAKGCRTGDIGDVSCMSFTACQLKMQYCFQPMGFYLQVSQSSPRSVNIVRS